MLFDSIYMTLWKRHSRGTKNRSVVARSALGVYVDDKGVRGCFVCWGRRGGDGIIFYILVMAVY